MLGVDVDEASGKPLTRVLRLEENETGEMPLISALAARHGFSAQRARAGATTGETLVLSGEVLIGGRRQLRRLSRHAHRGAADPAGRASARAAAIDQALDESLRSPLDRIIESAERIAERADGPLRNEYAAYANDISTAARHLLSVVRAMSEDPTEGQRAIDLAALAAEAVVMLDSRGRGAQHHY